MNEVKSDAPANKLTGTSPISCPDSGVNVGTAFTVCGAFSSTLKCPYKVRIRVYYMAPIPNSTNLQVQEVEYDADLETTTQKWKVSVNLAVAPAPNEDVLITARLFNKGTGGPLSPLFTTTAQFVAGTADPCGGADKCG
jgi:hypothetical protein